MDARKRIERLERESEAAADTVFFWRDGPELTPEQKAEVAEAEAQGRKVMIFGWDLGDEEPADVV